tara:strand:- start:14419 stop:14682 length:264 start_codon:yes stop_codon:yes gene_type:complete
MNHSLKKTGHIVGVLFVAFFALCMFWGLLLVDPALKELHRNLLLIAFPGFSFTAIGIVIGAAESYAYGWLFGALYAWLCKVTCAQGK